MTNFFKLTHATLLRILILSFDSFRVSWTKTNITEGLYGSNVSVKVPN